MKEEGDGDLMGMVAKGIETDRHGDFTGDVWRGYNGNIRIFDCEIPAENRHF